MGKTAQILDATLAPIVARCGVPGIAAAVVEGGEIAAIGCAGVRRRGTDVALTREDRFHLGSCTKAMTATLVGLAVEKGRLAWQTPLAEIFAPVLSRVRPEWWQVQVWHGLTHRAGFAPNPHWSSLAPTRMRRVFGLPDTPIRQQRLELTRCTLAQPPKSAAGAVHEYSNIGYIIIGAALEQVEGMSWEDQMRENLWRPLGITSGGFGAPGTLRAIDEPWGHKDSGRPVPPGSMTADWRVPPAYGPAGTAHMTIVDWARFVGLHLQGNPWNPHHNSILLGPQTFAALHTPAPAGCYAGGWELSSQPWARGPRSSDIGRVLHHDGSNGQWYAATTLAPERDTAFLVAINQNGLPALRAFDQVRTALINTIVPL